MARNTRRDMQRGSSTKIVTRPSNQNGNSMAKMPVISPASLRAHAENQRGALKLALREIDAQMPRQHRLRVGREIAEGHLHIKPPSS